jgi:micrococcal nuclease
MRTIAREDDRVSIEFDVQKRDKYRRLLGYVYLENGQMLNEEIIKAGYASPMTIPPNVKYQDRFLKLYREARDAKRGLFRE